MKKDVHDAIKEALGDENECYVLISCKKPNPEGNMKVEMSYDGDSTLAAYLIESAYMLVEEEAEQQLSLS